MDKIYQDDNQGNEIGHVILKLFFGLKNTRAVSLSGNIAPDVRIRLHDCLTNASSKDIAEEP